MCETNERPGDMDADTDEHMLEVSWMNGDRVLRMAQRDAIHLSAGALRRRVGGLSGQPPQVVRLVKDAWVLDDTLMLQAVWPLGASLTLSAVLLDVVDGTWKLDDTSVRILASQFVPEDCFGGYYDYCRYTVEAELPDRGGLRVVGGPGTRWGPEHYQVWQLQLDGTMHVRNAGWLDGEVQHIWQPVHAGAMHHSTPINGAVDGSWVLETTRVTIRASQFVQEYCDGPAYDYCRYTVEAELADAGGLRVVGGPGTSWAPNHFQIWQLRGDGTMHVRNPTALDSEQPDHIWRPVRDSHQESRTKACTCFARCLSRARVLRNTSLGGKWCATATAISHRV